MGMFFSNIHIKMTKDFSINDVKNFMDTTMTEKGYTCTDNNSEAEVTVGRDNMSVIQSKFLCLNSLRCTTGLLCR